MAAPNPTPTPTAQTEALIPDAISTYVSEQAAARGLPAELALGILGAENVGNKDFNPSLVSPKGAKGLWQLTAGAVKDTGRDPKTFQYNDPVESTQAALDYIGILHKQFDNPVLATAAYNAGPGAIRGIIAKGGGPEDLSDETQTYLINGDKYSGGYLTRPSDKVEPSGKVVQAAAPVADPTAAPTAAPSSMGMPGSEFLGNTLSSIKDAAINTATRFPSEVASDAVTLGSNVGSALGMTSTPPLPMKSSMEFPDFVNFATIPLGSGVGHAANTGISVGLGVLNVADATAKAKAQSSGVNWDDLGAGAKASRVMDEVNTDNMVEHLPALAASAWLGFMFGGKEKPTSLADDIAAPWRPKPPKVDPKAVAFNQEQQLAEAVDRQAMDAYARRLAPLEAQVVGAETKTRMSRLSPDATELEKQAFNGEVKSRLMTEYRVPPNDPSRPFFEKLLTDHGPTPIDPMQAQGINAALREVADNAKNTDRLRGPLSVLGRALGDDNNVMPQIVKLETKMARTGDQLKRSKFATKIAELESQLRDPTVQDVVDRSQAIEALRRNKAFKTNADARTLQIVNKLNEEMRKPGGLVETTLGPDAAALWTKGNLESRLYNEKIRTTDLITQAFADVGEGTQTLRNNLVAKEKMFRRSLGKTNYESLLDSAQSFDDLKAALPTPPKATAQPLKDIYLTPKQTKAVGLVHMLNQTFMGRSMLYGGPVAGLATAYNHPVLAGMGLSAAATAAIVTNPVVRKGFSAMVKNMDRMSSYQFQRSLARLVVAAYIEDSYGEQPTPVEPTPAEPPLPSAPTSAAPPRQLSSRRTGGPIPAPQSNRAIPGGAF